VKSGRLHTETKNFEFSLLLFIMTQLKWSQECKDALKSVRDDSAGVTLVAATYEGTSQDSVGLLHVGSGDGDALQALLKANTDKIVFALLRTTEKIDNSVTTKFAFVNFQGPQVSDCCSSHTHNIIISTTQLTSLSLSLSLSLYPDSPHASGSSVCSRRRRLRVLLSVSRRPQDRRRL
jgi:hypothetical protein